MRIWVCAVLALGVGGSAVAQSPPPSACMTGGGPMRMVSNAFGPLAHDAGERLKANDVAGARVSLDAALLAARIPLELSAVAQMEMVLAGTTGDVSHVEAAWRPMIASGCMTDPEIAKHYSDVEAIRAR